MELRSLNRIALEFVLIVAGVLVALAVDDWRQSRADIATEQYLLEGILGDLESDAGDLNSVKLSAYVRISAADRILQATGAASPEEVGLENRDSGWAQADVVTRIVEEARQEFPPTSMSIDEALRRIVVAHSMYRFNVSASTFTSATMSGDLDLVRDIELRAALLSYYDFASLLGGTIGDRAEDHWRHLRNVLADRGLHSTVPLTETELLDILMQERALTSEIAHAREFAISHVGMTENALETAAALAESVRAALVDQ